jgi:thiol-disulfide isomerase/thioredoxin
VLLTVLAGCSRAGTLPSASTPAQRYPLGLTRFPAADHRPLPDLSGATLTGGRISLVDLRGSIVVVNFWATWCEPCRTESPALVAVAGSAAGRGVRFVGVDEVDDSASALTFVTQIRSPYPHLVDPDATLLGLASQLVPSAAVPSTLVLDTRGRVAARVIGPVTAPQLVSVLDHLRAGG